MLGRLLSNRDVAILIVALVLFVLFALAGPRFLSENNLIDIARRAAILGILAVGMTYLFIAGELDLSIGSHYGFLLILMSFQEERLGIDPWLAAGVVILIGLDDRRGQRPAGDPRSACRRSSPRSACWRCCAARPTPSRAATRSRPRTPTSPSTRSSAPTSRARRSPTCSSRWLVVMLIGGIVLARTKFGSDVYATGGDVEAARNNGIDTQAGQARLLRADGRAVRPQRRAAVRPGRPRAAQRRGQPRAAGDRRGDHRRASRCSAAGARSSAASSAC